MRRHDYTSKYSDSAEILSENHSTNRISIITTNPYPLISIIHSLITPRCSPVSSLWSIVFSLITPFQVFQSQIQVIPNPFQAKIQAISGQYSRCFKFCSKFISSNFQLLLFDLFDLFAHLKLHQNYTKITPNSLFQFCPGNLQHLYNRQFIRTSTFTRPTLNTGIRLNRHSRISLPRRLTSAEAGAICGYAG